MALSARTRVLAVLVGGAIAATCVVAALQGTLRYSMTPDELVRGHVQAHQQVRLSGTVVTGTVRRTAGTFLLRGDTTQLPVHVLGTVPDVVREGQPVVVEGSLDAAGVFVADDVIARHGNEYRAADTAGGAAP